jgi:uncharacterized membrane protein
MKIFGHPVHMMLVHFPTALLPMDLVCSLIHYITGNGAFLSASFFAGMGGIALGWLAMIFGVWDVIKLYSQGRQDVMAKALLHGGINGTVVIIFSVIVLLQYTRYPSLQADSMAVLIVKAVAIGLMFIGNFIGAQLILKHKVAVQK